MVDSQVETIICNEIRAIGELGVTLAFTLRICIPGVWLDRMEIVMVEVYKYSTYQESLATY